MSIRRHTICNSIGSMLPIAVSLIAIPAYLGLIGEVRYGVLAIAWMMLGFFGLFDLVLGRATAQHIAALRDGTEKVRADAFWTALTMNTGLGVLGGLLIWPVADYYFSNVFKIEATLRMEVLAALPWLIASVPLATISGVLSSALQGREKYLEINIISGMGTIVFQLLPLLAALKFGANLAVLLPAAICARLLTLVALLLIYKKHVAYGHQIRYMRDKAYELLKFAGRVKITALVGPMMTVLDRLIVGYIHGAKSVIFNTMPFQHAEKTLIVPSTLRSALFPKLSFSVHDRQHEMATTAIKTLLVVITPLVLIG